MGLLYYWGVAFWALLSSQWIVGTHAGIPRPLPTVDTDDLAATSPLTTLSKEAQEELSKYLEAKIQEMKLKLHEHFEKARIRQKREIMTMLTLPDRSALQEEHIRVGEARPDMSNTISQYNSTCWASASYEDGELVILGTGRGDILLFKFNGEEFSLISSTKVTNVPYYAAFFNYVHRLWLVVLYGNYFELEHEIAVYTLDRSILYRRQIIPLDGYSALDLVVSKGIIYMTVSSYNRPSNLGTSRRAKVRLYLWKHTQFDIIASQETAGARSVAAWDVKGTLYVAVAQEQDDSGDYMIGSPVFVHNVRDDEKLTYIQIIRTIWPTKVVHFSLEGSNYLIFAGKYEARIFWWSGEQFLEFQILEGTSGAVDVQVMYLPIGEVMIAISLKTKVLFYTEDFSSKYILTFKLDLDDYAAEITSIKFLYRWNKYYYAMLTYRATGPNIPANAYKMNLVTYETTDHPRWDPLIACLVDLNDTLNERDRALQYIHENIDNVWVDDREQEITADVVVEGTVTAPKGQIESLILVTGNTNISQITHSGIRDDILKAGSDLQELSRDMQNVVYKSTNQIIDGVLRFPNAVYAMHSAVGSIHNDVILNNIPVSMLATSTLSVAGDQVIAGNFEFVGLDAKSLSVSGKINNVNIDDLLLVDGEQDIRGRLQFGDVNLLRDLILSEEATVNGISPTNWVTTIGHQIIDGKKTFRTLNVLRDIGVRSLTNGVDLSELANRVMLVDLDQVVTGQLSFEGNLDVVGDIHLKGFLNEAFNLTFLVINSVDRTSEETISGRKTAMAPIFVQNDVIIGQTVNGIDLSEQMVNINREQTLSGLWTFTSPIHFDKTLLTNLVNGIDLSEEVVLKFSDQPIAGFKAFASVVEVATDIVMPPGTTINGLIISAIPDQLVSRDDVTLIGETVMENIVVRGDVEAFAGINGFLIKDLEGILWRKSIPQTINVPVKFFGNWELLQDLEVRTTVNGRDLHEDFVHTFGNETITGVKTFIDEVTSNKSIAVVAKATINGVDWSLFEKVMVRTTGNHVIRGRKIFSSLNVDGDIIVNETVNGLKLPADVMLVDAEQTVLGTITLVAPITHVFGDIVAIDDILVDSTVNAIDVSSFASEVVLIDQEGRKPITNKRFSRIHVDQINSFGFIDGVNIEEMKTRVMTVDTPQDILAPKNLTSALSFRSDLMTGLLNGLNIGQHVDNVIYRTREEVIKGRKTMKGNVVIKGNLLVQGTVNGINIVDLSRKTMSRIQENLVLAPMNFASSISGPLMLEAPALLDGIAFPDMVFLSEESVLQGNVHIVNDLAVTGNIDVEGLVNGCNLNQLAADALYLFGEHQVIEGNKILASLEIHGNTFIAGLLNGINLDELYARMVTKSSNETLLAPLIFEDGLAVERLILNNAVNGVNLTHVFTDVVLKSRPQIITGDKVFTNENGIRILKDLISSGDYQIATHVNNVDINELYRTVVTLNGNQQIHGKKTFMDMDVKANITLNGQINGVDLSDVVLTYTSDSITGITTFTRPTMIRENLTVHGFVDGVNLEEVTAGRITLNGKDVFDVLLTFEDVTTISGNLMITQTVNGIPIQAMVTRHSNFPIDGSKSFTQDLIVGDDLEVISINGLNIQTLSENIIRYNRPENLPGTTVFENVVRVDSDIMVKGLVNNVKISEAKDYFDEQAAQIREAMRFFMRTVIDQERTLDYQFFSHKQQVLVFKHFELSQELTIGPTKKMLSSPMYSYFRNVNAITPATSMSVWGSNTVYCYGCGCCEEYATFLMDVKDDGTLMQVAGPHDSRYFPFVFGGEMGLQHGGFLMWTNGTSSKKKCQKQHKETMTIVSLARGQSLTDNVEENSVLFERLNSPYMSSTNFFVAGESVFMFTAFSYDKKTGSHHTNSTVLKYNEDANRWKKYQLLETYEAVDSDVMAISRGPHEQPAVYLAVANRMKVKGLAMPSVIYKWEPELAKFHLLKRITTNFASAVHWVNAGTNIFILFANEKIGLYDSDVYSSQYSEPVNVYKETYDDFEWYQSINLPGVSALESFKLGGETYVLAASNHMETTYVLRWEGINGFQIVQEISTPGVEDVHSYWSKNGDLCVAIASSTGNTKILKAIMEGPKSFTRIEGKPLYEETEEILQPKDVKVPSSYLSDFPFQD